MNNEEVDVSNTDDVTGGGNLTHYVINRNNAKLEK